MIRCPIHGAVEPTSVGCPLCAAGFGLTADAYAPPVDTGTLWRAPLEAEIARLRADLDAANAKVVRLREALASVVMPGEPVSHLSTPSMRPGLLAALASTPFDEVAAVERMYVAAACPQDATCAAISCGTPDHPMHRAVDYGRTCRACVRAALRAALGGG